MPYTAFNAKVSYIEKNPDVIRSFYNGIAAGLEYCHTHNSKEIAEVIAPLFPDTKSDELITMIENYKNADSWFKDPKIPENSFNNLQDMLIDNNEIESRVNYKDLIYEIN